MKVLFVCTGNAGRSQMAQALCRVHLGPQVRVESAGVAPWPHLHPVAVRLMEERGISLAGHYPKPVDAVADQDFDLVVTIGDPARARLERGPFSAAYQLHWDIPDPADADGTLDSEAAFRAAMAAIEQGLEDLRRTVPGLSRLSE